MQSLYILAVIILGKFSHELLVFDKLSAPRLAHDDVMKILTIAATVFAVVSFAWPFGCPTGIWVTSKMQWIMPLTLSRGGDLVEPSG